MASEVLASQEPGNTKLALDVSIVKGKTLKARRFQLTLNQVDKWDELKLWLEHYKSLNYGIACQEVAPTTGHVHIHCFVQFSNTIAMNLSKLCGAHIEPCRGSTKSNIDYIQKDGDIIWEVGEAPHQGTQYTVGDLKNAKIDELPWQMYNTATRVQQATANKVKVGQWRKKVHTYYLYGASDVHKSDLAEALVEHFGYDEFEDVKHIKDFWHGIATATGAAIYDDFRHKHMDPSEFINFTDYRLHNMNMKNGSIKNRYSLIIITTIQDWDTLYAGAKEEDREQFRKRCIPYEVVEGYDIDTAIEEIDYLTEEFNLKHHIQ